MKGDDKTTKVIWTKMQFAESVPLIGNLSKDNLDKLLKPIDPPVSFALVDTSK
jgi:hypothetical protein